MVIKFERETPFHCEELHRLVPAQGVQIVRIWPFRDDQFWDKEVETGF